jgi:signal transduction histidine kinase
MSLWIRLALLLSAVVGTTVFLAWVVTGRAVIAPFAREVMAVYLDHAVLIAEQVAAGEDPKILEDKLGLEIRLRDRPPPPSSGRSKRRCTEEAHGGHRMVWCRGPRAPVWVETPKGWVHIKRDLDVAKPEGRAGVFLLLISLVVIGASVGVALIATRPIAKMQRAMSRIAEGDLAHRLPLDGAKDLRAAASTFNRMADRVGEMLKTERSLMAGISHELRTPLARLRLELEILADQAAVPERRQQAMTTDLDQIDALIGEMLEISRLSIGERTLSRQRLAWRSIAEEAARRPELAGRTVAIEGDGEVVGDRDRLVRVVANLVTNAAKYSPADQPIEVRIEGSTLEVLDRGPGVLEAEIPRIFEPFYRGKSGPSGLGLGLMIAHQIVTLHGGTIHAQNREGGGLKVRVALPIPGS